MIKKPTCVVVLAYGLFLFLFGGYAYLKAGSMVSLIAGSGFGFLLILCSMFMFAKKSWAAAVATVLTLIITATFAARYTITSKTIPAILAVLSGGMLLFLLARIAKWKDED